MHWRVYIILCSDAFLYAGITTNTQRYLMQYSSGRGAKDFRRCSPCRVVYLAINHDHSSASCRKDQIKKLNPDNKED